MLNEFIQEHIKCYNKLRDDFLEQPLRVFLDKLKFLHKYEMNNDRAYLLEQEVKRVELEVKLEEINSIHNDEIKPEEIGVEGFDPNSKVPYLEEKLGGVTYMVNNNIKHRIVHAAMWWCMENDKDLSKLNKPVRRLIAKTVGTTEGNVKTQLGKVLNEIKGKCLSESDKDYYYAWLVNNGCQEPYIKFPIIIKKDSINQRLFA